MLKSICSYKSLLFVLFLLASAVAAFSTSNALCRSRSCHNPSLSTRKGKLPSSLVSVQGIAQPLNWYNEKLEKHPITTKIISSGVVGGLGDVLIQIISIRAAFAAGDAVILMLD